MMYDNYIKALEGIVFEVMKMFRTSFQEVLAKQGHVNTGKLSSDIVIILERNEDKITGKLLIQDYGRYVDLGVSADRIPFGGGATGATTSKYIQGLVNFWENKGLSTRQATRAAFATAKVHKREGMPTRNSSRFSEDGNRKNFIGSAIDAVTQDVFSLVSEKTEKQFLIHIEQPFVNILKNA